MFLKLKTTGMLLSILLLSGCTHMSHLALMSNGDLEGKNLSTVKGNDILTGESCGHSYSLSNAMNRALENTQYDTLIDIDVESTSALLVVGNCIKVTGKGINSQLISKG